MSEEIRRTCRVCERRKNRLEQQQQQHPPSQCGRRHNTSKFHTAATGKSHQNGYQSVHQWNVRQQRGKCSEQKDTRIGGGAVHGISTLSLGHGHERGVNQHPPLGIPPDRARDSWACFNFIWFKQVCIGTRCMYVFLSVSSDRSVTVINNRV